MRKCRVEGCDLERLPGRALRPRGGPKDCHGLRRPSDLSRAQRMLCDVIRRKSLCVPCAWTDRATPAVCASTVAVPWHNVVPRAYVLCLPCARNVDPLSHPIRLPRYSSSVPNLPEEIFRTGRESSGRFLPYRPRVFRFLPYQIFRKMSSVRAASLPYRPRVFRFLPYRIVQRKCSIPNLPEEIVRTVYRIFRKESSVSNPTSVSVSILSCS